MATAARVALRPNNEATRPSGKGRATTNYVNNSTDVDIISLARAQFLRARIGAVSPSLTAVTAALIFGEKAA